MSSISQALATELAETWETMAEMERDSSQGRRTTLRECADALRMLSSVQTRLDCPHTAPPTTPTSAPTEGAQLRPRAELQGMIDGLVAAFMREDDVRAHEMISALSEASERIRADTAALIQPQGEERS